MISVDFTYLRNFTETSIWVSSMAPRYASSISGKHRTNELQVLSDSFVSVEAVGKNQ